MRHRCWFGSNISDGAATNVFVGGDFPTSVLRQERATLHGVYAAAAEFCSSLKGRRRWWCVWVGGALRLGLGH